MYVRLCIEKLADCSYISQLRIEVQWRVECCSYRYRLSRTANIWSHYLVAAVWPNPLWNYTTFKCQVHEIFRLDYHIFKNIFPTSTRYSYPPFEWAVSRASDQLHVREYNKLVVGLLCVWLHHLRFLDLAPCPGEYPYALNTGQSCCRSLFDATNSSRLLDIYDEPNKCGDERDMIPCPIPGRLCRKRPKGKSKFLVGKIFNPSVTACLSHIHSL